MYRSRGFTIGLVAAIIAAIVLVAGVAYVNTQEEEEVGETSEAKTDAVTDTDTDAGSVHTPEFTNLNDSDPGTR